MEFVLIIIYAYAIKDTKVKHVKKDSYKVMEKSSMDKLFVITDILVHNAKIKCVIYHVVKENVSTEHVIVIMDGQERHAISQVVLMNALTMDSV